jgi:hypothetical protein
MTSRGTPRNRWGTPMSWSSSWRPRVRGPGAPGPQVAALWLEALVWVRMGNAERVADVSAQMAGALK